MTKKYRYNLLVTLVFGILIFIYCFGGHIFYSKEGYIILKKTPYTILKAFEESDGIYYYPTIVNGNNIVIELPPYMYTPMNLVSDKLGVIHIDILSDLKAGKEGIDKSYYADIIKDSKYSRNQLNLIYKYFDYYFNENRILTIPNYSVEKGKNITISIAILIILYIVVARKYEYNKIKNNLVFHIIFTLGLLVSLYISGHLIITKI